jgi:transposase
VHRFDIAKILKDAPMYKTSLTDEQWQVVERFFNKTNRKATSGRPVKTSYRLILYAILYTAVTGVERGKSLLIL